MFFARSKSSSPPNSVSINPPPKCTNLIWIERSKYVHSRYANEIVQKFIYSKNRLKEVVASKLKSEISLSIINENA